MPRRMKGSIGKELATVRRSLRELDRSLAGLVHLLRAGYGSGESRSRTKPRHKLKLSPARLRALRLHGRYIGYLRHLKPRQKVEVRALRERRGVNSAIARARRLLRR
jgi:hypothetical protein